VLIASPRHTAEDLRVWERLKAFDERLARSPLMGRRIDSATAAIRDFAARGPCYLGVSWGKDSVATAGLAMLAGLAIPIVWVRAGAEDNPDCELVRDAFLSRFSSARYEEINVTIDTASDRIRAAHKAGFKRAGELFGERHISGVRSDESAQRTLSAKVHGIATELSCRPILRWSGVDVYAYLHREGLPVHPAYACTMGGQLDRIRVRVAGLGGPRGTGYGRREWEWTYYRAELVALGLDGRVIDTRD
jgi:phosphoadenosine phosphosulfate reductase